MPRDYYDILGVNHNATKAQLKKAYRKLARTCHPDVNPGSAEAEARFKAIQEAYTVLSNPQKRQIYDQVGHEAFVAGARSAPQNQQVNFEDLSDIFGRTHAGPGGFSYTYTSSDPSSTGSGGIHELFEQLFQQGHGTTRSWEGSPFAQAQRRPVRQKGADRQHSVSISFDDAYSGKELTLRDEESGTLKVRIPAGVESGGKVRVAAKGEPGINGGPPGDLLLHVTVQDHPYFERRGNNIYLTVPITYSEAALSATIEVPTMGGRVQMKIPAGTQSASEFRLRGKGFPHLKGPGRGDQIVRIEIVVPRGLDLRSRELLREFDKLNPGSPRVGKWE
jgi:DnaJ-class molecular chaperone